MAAQDWTYRGRPWDFTSAQGLIDSVRFLIGDTNTLDQQLLDGEINGLLVRDGVTIATVSASSNGAIYLVAVECARALVAKYSRQVTKGVGPTSIQASERAAHYRELVKDLTAQSFRHAVPVPYSGGMRESDMDIDQGDEDLVQPAFAVGMDDNPGGAGPTEDDLFRDQD